jgi:hypothetical protein
MYPSLDRSSSALSFVTQTTKIIQTDSPKDKKNKHKPIRNVEMKSIGINASMIMEKSVGGKTSDSKSSSFKKKKIELRSGTTKGE